MHSFFLCSIMPFYPSSFLVQKSSWNYSVTRFLAFIWWLDRWASLPFFLRLISLIFVQFSRKHWSNNRLAPPPLQLSSPHHLVNSGSATTSHVILSVWRNVHVDLHKGTTITFPSFNTKSPAV